MKHLRRLVLPLLTALFAVALTTRTATDGRLSALSPQTGTATVSANAAARIALGRLLFWDPILSSNGDVACATCHHPDFAYTDGRDLSLGTNSTGLGPSRVSVLGHNVAPVRRNSPTLLNVAFNGLTADRPNDAADAPMFWDLRVKGLEAQALEPIKAHDEMRGDGYSEAIAVSQAITRIAANAEYRRLFQKAFGASQGVTAANLGSAIASFERTLVTANSAFDRYMRGDADAMTAEQIRGMERFETAGCVNCHSGPMLSDFTPHVLGVPDHPQLADSDTGTGSYAFRTPTLRNVGLTGPYMHNGVFTSLEDVLDFYRRVSFGRGGGRRGRFGLTQRGVNPNVSRDGMDPLLRQLNMRGRGQRDIIAFLQALDDPNFDKTVPARVPSGLEVGGHLGRR